MYCNCLSVVTCTATETHIELHQQPNCQGRCYISRFASATPQELLVYNTANSNLTFKLQSYFTTVHNQSNFPGLCAGFWHYKIPLWVMPQWQMPWSLDLPRDRAHALTCKYRGVCWSSPRKSSLQLLDLQVKCCFFSAFDNCTILTKPLTLLFFACFN